MERQMTFKDKPVVIPTRARDADRGSSVRATLRRLQWVREEHNANLIEAGATRGHLMHRMAGSRVKGRLPPVRRRQRLLRGRGRAVSPPSKIGESGKFIGDLVTTPGPSARSSRCFPWNHTPVW